MPKIPEQPLLISADDAVLLEKAASKDPISLTVNEATSTLIAHLQQKLTSTYDVAADVVGSRLGVPGQEVMSMASSKNPAFIEERLVGIVSRLQGALNDIPGNYVVKSSLKKKN